MNVTPFWSLINCSPLNAPSLRTIIISFASPLVVYPDMSYLIASIAVNDETMFVINGFAFVSIAPENVTQSYLDITAQVASASVIHVSYTESKVHPVSKSVLWFFPG